MRTNEELINVIKDNLKYLKYYNYELVEEYKPGTKVGICSLISYLETYNKITLPEYRYLDSELTEYMKLNIRIYDFEYAHTIFIHDYEHAKENYYSPFRIGDEKTYAIEQIKLCVSRYKIFIDNFLISLNYD